MPDTNDLTPARRRALAVLTAAEHDGTTVRYSNLTSQPGVKHPSVYWQTCDWLVAEGLAEEHGIRLIRLTPPGRVLAGKTAAQERAESREG